MPMRVGVDSALIYRPLISPNSLQLSQVFASSCWLNLDPVQVAVDFLIEFVQGAAHRCVVRELVGQQFSQYGSEQTGMTSREPQGDLHASFGHHVTL